MGLLYNYITDLVFRDVAKETFNMDKNFVGGIAIKIMNGDAYAIGGYIFEVASLFVGVGEINAAIKGTKFATTLAKGATAFKVASKTKIMAKLGKVVTLAQKAIKYGEDALKAILKKIRNFPIPKGMEELVLDDGTIMRVMGKQTLGDVIDGMKTASKFSDEVAGVGKKASGHGQSNIDFLKENGLEANIEKAYPNGVRTGNVPHHLNVLEQGNLGFQKIGQVKI